MSLDVSAPFPRGKTFGTTLATDGVQWEGYEKYFMDYDYSQAVGPIPIRSNRMVLCRVMRNAAATALEPKRLVSLKAGTYNKHVDGYADVFAERAVVVDEFLPSAGVPVNDLFWAVVEGPSLISTSLAADAGNVITEGQLLVAATAATSGATTSGRIRSPDYTGANSTGSALGDQLANAIGRAMSARTTANTGGAASLNTVLVDVVRLK